MVSFLSVPGLCKRTRKLEKSFSYQVINELMSRIFWWIKKSVTLRTSCCTVSKAGFWAGDNLVFHSWFKKRTVWACT